MYSFLIHNLAAGFVKLNDIYCIHLILVINGYCIEVHRICVFDSSLQFKSRQLHGVINMLEVHILFKSKFPPWMIETLIIAFNLRSCFL